jgi:hypothetical protein
MTEDHTEMVQTFIFEWPIERVGPGMSLTFVTDGKRVSVDLPAITEIQYNLNRQL